MVDIEIGIPTVVQVEKARGRRLNEANNIDQLIGFEADALVHQAYRKTERTVAKRSERFEIPFDPERVTKRGHLVKGLAELVELFSGASYVFTDSYHACCFSLVFGKDFKVFSRGNVKFGVGQSIYMTDKSRAAAEALVGPFLPEAARRESLPMIFYMFTDMKTQSTDLMFCGRHTDEIVRDAFGVEPKDGMAVLPGVVSRKKQLLPPLLAALQARQD